MRVLHVTSARTRRGGENQLFYLACGLRSRGIETALVIPEDASYSTPMSGTMRIRFRGEADLPAIKRLASVIREYTPDIIHAHTGHAHAWAAMAMKRSDRLLFVSRRVLFSPSRNPISRWKMKRVSRFLCVSNAVAEAMRVYGIEPDRLRVVHSGVPMTGTAPGDTDLRMRFGTGEDDILALSLAAFTPNKNQATLVCALSLIPGATRPRCILAGEGRMRVRTERLARDLDLMNSVHFPGFVEDPGELIRAADLFVLSSLREGLSTATLEAMAGGLPVVASRCGGVEDLVIDGETGILFPPGNPEALASAISTLIDDPELMRSMGEKGRERAELFSVDHMVESTLLAYRELC
jgi:glycosyltransferase involved in cell wall biosynthesis